MLPMPRLPIIWQAAMVAAFRSLATPELASPKKISSATIPPKAMAMRASISVRVLRNRSSSSEWARRPSASLRLMMESTSSLRPLPTSQATTACPDSWVAMVRRSASAYSTGWARPISSVILAFWMSAHERRSPWRRRAQMRASSRRCSIITGEYPNVTAASVSRWAGSSSSASWAFFPR